MFIWRKLLQLPENFTAYAALVDKGAHPAYAKLHESYPIKSRKLLRVLQRWVKAEGERKMEREIDRDNEVHPAYIEIHKNYPINSRKLLTVHGLTEGDRER